MTDWAIPQQAKLKYTQLFNLHDRSHSGFLSGLQCRDILLQSGLPRNILAEIWNLSDIDGDGQLTREEFILAMHLTNNVRSGQTLPNELPKDLIPPSYRRTRSISQSSVQSATSASSSTITNTNNSGNNNIDDANLQKSTDSSVLGSMTASSVLNSNSFEDKRRENFEKGRAELDRRRLKIIEQQMSILKEQLSAGKKLVGEAKAKIDALRADRDTKMGMITFLEAQLKTLQDKKAFLNQEELNLIAIAKDLNLVNDAAAQAELDELATQAKQQSINQMKEKLKDLAREKEEKSKELGEVNSRLDEYKSQLKTITETVTKTYSSYKEKVAEAKTKREQFINETKGQIANLDSAWDSAPSFTPTPAVATSLTNQSSRLPETTTTTNSNLNDDPWGTSANEPTSITAAFSTATNNEQSIDSPFSINSTTLNNNNNVTKATDALLTGNGFDSMKITEPKLVKKYKALYAFEARNVDELTVEPGDIIVGSEHVCEPGWLFGECNGRSGLFPEAYVEPITSDDNKEENNITPVTTTTSSSSILPQFNASTNQPSESSFQSNSFLFTSDANSTTSTTTKYKVIYAFDARNPDELTIKPGDIIIGLEGVTEPGWLSGRLDGQKGLFPEAYVERMPASETTIQDQNHPEPGALQRMSSLGSLRSKKSRSKSRAEVATVIANYRALGNEQLNLEKGQLVLIRRKMDSGWWEGEIQVKGKKKQFGWFPATYVKLLSNNPLGGGGGGGGGAGATANPSQ